MQKFMTKFFKLSFIFTGLFYFSFAYAQKDPRFEPSLKPSDCLERGVIKRAAIKFIEEVLTTESFVVDQKNGLFISYQGVKKTILGEMWTYKVQAANQSGLCIRDLEIETDIGCNIKSVLMY